MYTIEVTCDTREEGRVLLRLQLTEIVKEKKVCHLRARYSVEGGSLVSLEKKEALRRKWKGYSVEKLGRGLMSFFLETRKVCSTEWTEFWYVKKDKAGSLEYRMYGCSMGFVVNNARVYGSK